MEFRRVLFRSPPYPGIGRFADIEAFSVRAECKTMPALRQSGRIQEIDACPLKRSVYFFEHYPDEFWMVHLPYQQLPAVRAKAIFGNWNHLCGGIRKNIMWKKDGFPCSHGIQNRHGHFQGIGIPTFFPDQAGHLPIELSSI